jgi:hypothetical protein
MRPLREFVIATGMASVRSRRYHKLSWGEMREAVTGSKGASEKVHCSLLLLQIALIPTISLSGRYLNRAPFST